MVQEPTAKDLKWMAICAHAALLMSTCGKAQYFAIVLDRFGHQVSSGWNGAPKGMLHCKDGGCPRFIAGSPSGSSYDDCIAIHAEANALLHGDYTAYRDGAALYVNGEPCFTCAKLIANSGIRRVVFQVGRANSTLALTFLEHAGVELVPID